jgi:hypothetical protein
MLCLHYNSLGNSDSSDSQALFFREGVGGRVGDKPSPIDVILCSRTFVDLYEYILQSFPAFSSLIQSLSEISFVSFAQWWAKLLRLLTVNSLSYFVKIKY